MIFRCENILKVIALVDQFKDDEEKQIDMGFILPLIDWMKRIGCRAKIIVKTDEKVSDSLLRFTKRKYNNVILTNSYETFRKFALSEDLEESEEVKREEKDKPDEENMIDYTEIE